MPRWEGRQSKVVDGVMYRRCIGPCGKWKVLHQDFAMDNWTVKGKKYYRWTCRGCHNQQQARKRHPCLNQHGLVPLDKIQPILYSLISLVGYREAARRIGVNSGQMWRWTDQGYWGDKRKLQSIQKHNAARIMFAYQEAKKTAGNGMIHTFTFPKDKCQGCGGDFDGFTEGCKKCSDRLKGRAKRASVAV